METRDYTVVVIEFGRLLGCRQPAAWNKYAKRGSCMSISQHYTYIHQSRVSVNVSGWLLWGERERLRRRGRRWWRILLALHTCGIKLYFIRLTRAVTLLYSADDYDLFFLCRCGCQWSSGASQQRLASPGRSPTNNQQYSRWWLVGLSYRLYRGYDDSPDWSKYTQMEVYLQDQNLHSLLYTLSGYIATQWQNIIFCHFDKGGGRAYCDANEIHLLGN